MKRLAAAIIIGIASVRRIRSSAFQPPTVEGVDLDAAVYARFPLRRTER